MIGSIVVVGVLTHCALLHSIKVAKVNVQYSLIQDLTPYVIKLDHNATEATKNISYAKGEGAIGHSTVTR